MIAANAFNEVVRVRAADLNPAKPGIASTFGTGTPGANGLAIDRAGNVYVSGGANGTVYRVPAAGGAAQPVAQIERFTRTLPDGRTQQPIVANGLAFDASGALLVADTARGALWKVTLGADGRGGPPVLLARDPLLEGADGITVDRRGDIWVAVNELNAIVKVTPAGETLLAHARRHSRRADEAEDLVQQTLLAGLEAGRGLHPRAGFGARDQDRARGAEGLVQQALGGQQLQPGDFNRWLLQLGLDCRTTCKQ